MTEQHDHEHIVAIDENGKEIVFAVITRAYSEEFDKEYVLFAEHSHSDEPVEVQAAAVLPGEDGEELVGIETDAEWEFIESVLAELDAEEED
ncbi:MAG: DUF1292 domain-containing protein [Kurthia sp.]|nr:DUF1292 domain-containing protein [Candidatus Kurthia equi]